MNLYSVPFRSRKCVRTSTCLSYEVLTITGKSEPDYCEFVWYQKTSAFISKQRDINFKSKCSAIYEQLHEENNPTDLFFNAKNPQTNQP